MKVFRINESGLLQYKNGESFECVDVKKCFPLSKRVEYLSIINAKGVEVFFIEQTSTLEDEDYELIMNCLLKTEYIFIIKDIHFLEESTEFLKLTVETNSGARTMFLNKENYPEVIGEDQYLLKDVMGDVYRVNYKLLDKFSKQIIDPLLG